MVVSLPRKAHAVNQKEQESFESREKISPEAQSSQYCGGCPRMLYSGSFL